MDKNKVTIILIALAVVLALFLLYQYGKSKIETSDKLANADADLEIKKANDEYLAEKEEAYRDRTVKEVTEGSYEDAYQQTTIAEGYTSLQEYRNSLTEGEKVEYDNDRTTYIEVMGKDPGLMSLAQLREWYKNYTNWAYLNEQYIDLTGESKSFLDPEFDTVAEMKAAVKSAQAEIEIAKQLADNEWQEAYIQLNQGTDGLEGFGGFNEKDLKKYCPTTAKLSAFHTHLQRLAYDWEIHTKKDLKDYMKNVLYPSIVNDLKWTTKSQNNVEWINAFDLELCKSVIALSPAEKLYLMSLYNSSDFPEFKAVSQYTRVNSTRDPHDAVKLYTMTAAMRNRLKVSGLAFVPVSAKSFDEVTGFAITYDSPKNCGSHRSKLIDAVGADKYAHNIYAENLVNMILSLEDAAENYTETYYGVAFKNGETNLDLLKNWAEDIAEF